MVGDNTFFKDDANGAEKIKQRNEEQMPHKQDDEGKSRIETSYSNKPLHFHNSKGRI